VDYKWIAKPDIAYKDVLAGYYTIVADGKGLRIENLSCADGKSIPEGLRPLVGKWDLKENFSIPEIRNKRAYALLNQI